MRNYYFQGRIPNFGDDLNALLWPRLIPEALHDDGSDAMLLGIGSILFDTFPPALRKVVIGSGYAGYTPKPDVDDKWTFYFVRGPRTAAALGLDPELAITDAAILLRTVYPELGKATKKYPISFMPHWESAEFGTWKEVTDAAGINLIDPRSTVESTLEQLSGTELLITEAMHGAIAADALRVPWVPVIPNNKKHHFKWLDWCDSLDIPYRPNRMGTSNVKEFVNLKGLAAVYPARLVRKVTGRHGGGFDAFFRRAAAKRLKELARLEPSLSTDAACEMRTEQAVAKLAAFKADYRLGRYS
jgi:succinoglycan biosynthesis protein ExoV